MDIPEQKIGKIFLTFAGICVIALPLIILSVLSHNPDKTEAAVIEPQSMEFDQRGGAVFADYDRITRDYLEGTSTERTLSEYYSRRQYPGSPPFVPHKLEDNKNNEMVCLACHEKGGWTEELKRNTPLTPHPQNTSCMQCHVKPETEELFVVNNWMSVPPPRLGRSYLPGSPPPVPHDLQLRGECMACHVGPGAVTTIRVEHPSRGNCRQCHVRPLYTKPFKSKYSAG
jgi:cytochrome c-type protein NapB